MGLVVMLIQRKIRYVNIKTEEIRQVKLLKLTLSYFLYKTLQKYL